MNTNSDTSGSASAPSGPHASVTASSPIMAQGTAHTASSPHLATSSAGASPGNGTATQPGLASNTTTVTGAAGSGPSGGPAYPHTGATESAKAESEAPSNADAAAMRSHKRRPHTKSRNGCTTCKRRRVKCDETRPVCKNCQHLRLECLYASPAVLSCADLQLMNLRLLHHYDAVVAKTISDSGISTEAIWARDVVEMGLDFPFLMHAILMFSATHLAQKQPKEYCHVVVQHRSMALTLLRSEVQHINADNLDPLVATSVLLILDAMANASLPSRMTPSSLPASTWLHHVRGAATILLAVGVLPPTSKFYSFMGFDLLDLASCYPPGATQGQPPPHAYSDLQCTIGELAPLYPVAFDSPYFSSLSFLDKLSDQRDRADFILRVFSFPALMDKNFVALLAAGDRYAKLIVSAYYRLVRQYVKARQHRVWFLEGVSTVLPIDMDNEFGGLGFVTDALPIPQNVDSILARFDEVYAAAEQKLNQIVSGRNQMPPVPNSSLPGATNMPMVSQHINPQQINPQLMNNQGQMNQAMSQAIPPQGPHQGAHQGMQQSMNTPGMNPQGLNTQGMNTQPPLHGQGQMPQQGLANNLEIKLENLDDQFSQDYLDNMDIRFRPRQDFTHSPPDPMSATSSMSTPNHSLAASPQAMVTAAATPSSIPFGTQQQQQSQMPLMANQMPGNQMPGNQMPGNQMPSNQMPGNQMSNNQMHSNQMQNNQMQNNQMQNNQTQNNQMQNNQINSNQMNSHLNSHLNGSQMPHQMNHQVAGRAGGNAPNAGPPPSANPPGMQVSGYDPMLDPSHSLISELMPHTYGRIQKQMTSAGAASGHSAWPRSRGSSGRPSAYMRARNRHIVRPGMMSVPLDPSIPNDLLGGFEFGGGNEANPDYVNDVDTDMGLEPTDLNPANLEWQTPPSELQRPLNQWMAGNRVDKSLEETMELPEQTSDGQPPQPVSQPQQKSAGFGGPVVKEELDDNLDRLIDFDEELGLGPFD